MYPRRVSNLNRCVSSSTTSDPPVSNATGPDFARPSDPEPPPPAAPGSSRGRSGWRNAIEWVVIIAAALAVAVVVKTFLFQAFYIPSESMEPTLKPGDRVLVNKLSYKVHPIHRGDIVVFKRPPAETSDPAIKDLIKRVIGLPGDTIESIDNKVYINGKPLNEPYLEPGTPTASLIKHVIAPGEYFVMGDNRTNSKDSRFIGAIPGSLIVGRAFVRVWPFSGFGFL
jgi:signal peptidase I